MLYLTILLLKINRLKVYLLYINGDMHRKYTSIRKEFTVEEAYGMSYTAPKLTSSDVDFELLTARLFEIITEKSNKEKPDPVIELNKIEEERKIAEAKFAKIAKSKEEARQRNKEIRDKLEKAP